MPRARYTEELKRRVAARVVTDGISQHLVAQEFRIPVNNVFRWCHDQRFVPQAQLQVQLPPQPQPQLPPQPQPQLLPQPQIQLPAPPQPQPPVPQQNLPRGMSLLSNFVGVSEIERVKIGEMNVVCVHCSAKRYKSERKGFCCVEGKVVLPEQNEINGEIENLLLSKSILIKSFNFFKTMPSFGRTLESTIRHLHSRPWEQM